MDTLSRTMRLYKDSFRVLSADGEILLFPVLSGLSAVALFAGFFIPLYRDGTLEALRFHRAGWADYATLFLWYYLNYFLGIFFNTALIGCACIRLKGGDPTLADGFRIAFSRMDRISIWALVAATVGVMLSAFNNRRGGLASRLLGAALSVGWTLMTYLIVPVIVVEDRGVFDAIHRSAHLFRKQWGEELLGGFGFSFLNLLALIPCFGLCALLWHVDKGAALIVAGLYAVFLAVITSAMMGVFRAALYQYAASGEAPAGFSAEALDPTARSGRNAF
jgi:hypothetical protein